MAKALPAPGHDVVTPGLFDERPIDLDGFRLRDRGIEIVGKPTIRQFQKALQFASGTLEASPYWVGDLIAYAEGRLDWQQKLEQAMTVTKLAKGTLENLATVSRHVGPAARELAPSIGHATIVAPMPPAAQREWLERAVTEGWSVSEFRAEVRADKKRGVIEGQASLEGRYRVIYADPPWSYSDRQKSGSSAKDHYPAMSIDELCALPVLAHAMPNAVLFLWTTSPFLLLNPGPREVLEAWGFDYKGTMIWDKVKHNVGSYVSVRHEILIIATRGQGTPDRPTPMPDSVVTHRVEGEHSAKPDVFRKVIEKLYDGPYLEMFARQQVEGWTCWGNQVLQPVKK